MSICRSLALLSVLVVCGCASSSSHDEAMAQRMVQVSSMAHDPITRLAFVPTMDAGQDIKIEISRIEPAAGEDVSEDAGKVSVSAP
ncbi:MAG: hypothetical protein KDI13_02040 [Alphaproteobacteria bacterium]|nr:hypothetical protein [Alphaproteobacteria bacterium]